jgi:hypothetical protein
MLNGIDVDENGSVEPLPGEAGVQVAYEQAYRMADMPLQAVGIQNLGTGTPTFILVAPTKTPGGGGGASGSTQAAPPGQQRTAKPPPGQQKTKGPPKNSTGSSNDTTTKNGNNSGN